MKRSILVLHETTRLLSSTKLRLVVTNELLQLLRSHTFNISELRDILISLLGSFLMHMSEHISKSNI